jgi:hypothetical protein
LPCRLAAVVRAAWFLHARLQKFTAGTEDAVSEHLLMMRVVREAK